jgi:hypothetical protein
MKNKKSLILLTMVLFTGFNTSCEEEFLDETTTSFVDTNVLLETEEGAEIYVIGAYDAIRVLATGYEGWLSMWGTLGADEIVVPNWGADPKQIYLQTISPSNSTIRTIWENLYISVNKTNSVIDRVSAMTEDQISEDKKNKLVGEAKFLRATLYLALVSAWENVPLVSSETLSFANLLVSQDNNSDGTIDSADTKIVYDLIIEDLLYSESVLEEGQGGGRATKGAAQTLLGKVYLQMTGFPLFETDKFAFAEAKLEAVINSGIYQLETLYPEVFSIENEQNNEMIFAIGFDGPGLNQGGKLGTFYGPQGRTENGGQAGNNWFINWELAGDSQSNANGGSGTWGARNDYDFAQGYQEDDIRCRNNVAKHRVNEPQNWTAEDGLYNPTARKSNIAWRRPTWKPWKWHNIRPSNWGTDTPFDQPYLRYADVLLMHAEAKNGQGTLTQTDIDNSVNLLRARARQYPDGVTMPETIAANMMIADQTSNANEILSERRKELCLEGWRRNDLIRHGKYQQAINVTQPSWSNSGNPQTQYSDFEIRWPIPTSELLINPNLVQNPGY